MPTSERAACCVFWLLIAVLTVGVYQLAVAGWRPPTLAELISGVDWRLVVIRLSQLYIAAWVVFGPIYMAVGWWSTGRRK